MSLPSTKLLSFAAISALLASSLCIAQTPSTPGAAAPLTVKIVNSATHQPALDPTVTVNGKVLSATNGAYTLPANTQSVMARAPGYRALTTLLAGLLAH